MDLSFWEWMDNLVDVSHNLNGHMNKLFNYLWTAEEIVEGIGKVIGWLRA